MLCEEFEFQSEQLIIYEGNHELIKKLKQIIRMWLCLIL